jgi:hypothetical protein
MIGGYLSRISAGEMRRQHSFTTVHLLLRLSEGLPIAPDDVAELKRRAASFVDRAQLGYVLVDVAHTSPDLRRIAIDTTYWSSSAIAKGSSCTRRQSARSAPVDDRRATSCDMSRVRANL